ncbi:Tubulin polyglutamylase TTLL4-like [Homarus americanus]|uniref:Tubulin polyglutamylase TTLL4-like n=1 Tax=Homarus americanus TaxID=6706 RepID=A0A8J5N0P0_HOMAM|nr:Tubulin polyglutamylase TTLL4-like [Homarus americanus]
MFNHSCVWSSSQRLPLNPLVGGQQRNTMKVSEASAPTRLPTNTTQQTICKRHSPENASVAESENAPFPVHNKRQRTKSGSDPMEPLATCQDSAIPPTDCCVKGEPTPLCERNVRTSRLEGGQEISTQNMEPACSCTKWDSSSSDNIVAGDCARCDSTRDCKNNSDVDLTEQNLVAGVYPGHSRSISNGTASGGLSPHCAATLEYVTQLPEGCSGGVANSSVLDPPTLNGACEPNEELEDDDNYLDSSDDDEEDELTLTNNEDEESCGEGSLLYTETPAPSPLPSLSPSLFSHVPPSINFCQYNEKTVEFPLVIGRLLKWRFTNITPLIVRKTIANSGFRITKKTLQWCGTWGKHMKSPCFKAVREFQKINHFPGTFQVGRKDKLWKNFLRLQTKFGKDEFGFIPKTFVLPGDLKALKAAFDKEGVKKKWIVKPPASARGTGIQVVHKWSQVPHDSPVVVQRYISRPYLINDTKFDIRIYVLVTSFHPLRIYLYQDGLVRFASVQYNNASTSLNDRYMHLTNYSVNKSSSSYTHNADAGQCQGHKWTIKSLWGYLKAKDVDTSALWSRIADLVIKTIISGEHDIVVRSRKNVRSRYSCHELFGFDVIIDERLRPWLLEVNISPSLHSASPLDHSVKGPLIADLLNMVAFHIPDKLSQQQQMNLLGEYNLGDKVTGLCLDRRLYTRLLTAEEQVKHIQVNALPRSQYLVFAIENLSSDDVRHLLASEDELHRAGKFMRIFPTVETYSYFGFMDKPRYYNRLMDAWENAYGSCREKAIERLENLCVDKFHLRVPPAFKMPKVTVSGGFKVTTRRPSSPLLGKSFPQSQSSTQLHLNPLPQSLKGRKKLSIARKARKFRTLVHPLKPAVVSSYLLVREVSAGRILEETEEEFMETEDSRTEEEDMIKPVGGKVVKEGMEQIQKLTLCDEPVDANAQRQGVQSKRVDTENANIL